MKKILTLLFVGIALFGYAQKFQLTDPKGNPYADGQTISVTITEGDLNPFDGEYVTDIHVENLVDTEWLMQTSRTNTLADGIEAYVCFGSCFPNDVFDIDYEFFEGLGASYALHLAPIDTLGVLHYGLCQFKLDFIAEDQSMTLFVNIDVQSLGVKEQNPVNVSLAAYPNPAPANSLIHVSYTLANKNDDNRLVIRNILGTRVMNISLNPYTDRVSIDISPLVSGIYFYSIENRNSISIAKKLIVK